MTESSRAQQDVIVDVVVATRDRPAPLDACLRALAAQCLRGVRVIVLDDGSRVPVASTLDPALREALDLRLLRNEVSRGPAAARNRAVAAGDAPYVAFIDDDVRAEPDLLARQAALMRARGPEAILIGPLSAPPDWRPTAWNRWEAAQLEVEYGRMARGEYRPTWRQFHTGNAFLPRATFEALGGFDEQFTRAEDVEFALRAADAGHTFAFNPEAVGWHDARRTRAAWLRIPRAYAEFDVLMDRLHPQAHWLRIVRRERARRHALVRAGRLAARVPLGASVVAPALAHGIALGAATLHAAGARTVPMALLSVAYDLQYEAGFRRALRDASPPDGPSMHDGATAGETLGVSGAGGHAS